MQEHTEKRRETRVGLVYALMAFVSWGFIAVFFKAVDHVAPLEVLAHRVVWAAVFLLAWGARTGRLGAVRAALADRRTRRALLVSTTLILGNWFLFIWAVVTDQLLEASLGFYVNPLLNVALGAVFLRERLTRWQAVAVFVALLAVLHHSAAVGVVPYLGLGLAFCFASYGLVRKMVAVDSAVGLTAETLTAALVAVGWLVVCAVSERLTFLHGGAGGFGTDLLLLAAGPVTALPLLWFVHAARRLRYATVGFLQYLAPTLQFVIAVVYFGEPFRTVHFVTFAIIWVALAVYTWDAVRTARRVAPDLRAIASPSAASLLE